MGKSTEPPTCRFCGKAHRGTCMDHDAQGAISTQRDITSPVRIKPSMADLVQRIIPSGGSSAVERRPSKAKVEGSTPSPRSKKQAEGAGGKSTGVKRGRGRPKVVEDRKAYLAQKAKERRARQKSLKPST